MCLMFDDHSKHGAGVPATDDGLGAEQRCSAMGRGQKNRSPTVPVSRLSETHTVLHSERDGGGHMFFRGLGQKDEGIAIL